MVSKLIQRIKVGFADRLRDPARRRRMFVRMAQDEIAMQIRALRERRGFATQSAFAAHAGMQQSAVSRIENADYMGWSFKTLLKVADILDARLRVSFEPAEDVLKRFENAERGVGPDTVIMNPPVSVGDQTVLSSGNSPNDSIVITENETSAVPIELLISRSTANGWFSEGGAEWPSRS